VFCPKCGARNEDNAAFCASCGASLAAGNPAPTSPAASNPQSGRSSGIQGVFQDAIALVMHPREFMTARAEAAPPLMSTLTNYVAILAVIPFLFTLIGEAAFHKGADVAGYAIVAGIIGYIFAIVSFFVVSYIVSMLAPRFASSTDQGKAAKLVSYVYTPVYLVAILNIVPALRIVSFLGLLYGLYIFWIGLPIVLKTPKDKVLAFFIATLVAAFIVYFILTLIVLAL
jgi:hypothetical protein